MSLQSEQVKQSEIRGSIAAFCDAGLVKVANEEGFNLLCDAVMEKVGEEYDLGTVANAVDEVIAEASGESSTLQKQASDEVAFKATIGDLTLMKIAGEIDDDTYVAEVGALMKSAGLMPEEKEQKKEAANQQIAIEESAGKKSKARKAADYLKGKAGDAYKYVKNNKGKVGLVAGGVAGLAGVGALGKALYDKNKK